MIEAAASAETRRRRGLEKVSTGSPYPPQADLVAPQRAMAAGPERPDPGRHEGRCANSGNGVTNAGCVGLRSVRASQLSDEARYTPAADPR